MPSMAHPALGTSRTVAAILVQNLRSHGMSPKACLARRSASSFPSTPV